MIEPSAVAASAVAAPSAASAQPNAVLIEPNMALPSGALLLDRVSTASCLNTPKLLTAISTALIAVSRGDASAPPRIAAASPRGLLGAMPGYVPGLGLAAKLISVFPAKPSSPGTHGGIVGLFDEHDGRLMAVLDADAITGARTAGSATVAMQALAGELPQKIAVIGSGVQASAQVRLLAQVAPNSEVVVGARSPAQAATLAALHRHASVSDIERAVRWADMVFCCTDSREPVIRHDWLSDGMFISSVGGSNGPELEPQTIAEGNVFVEWPGAVSSRPPAGAHELQALGERSVSLIGAVLDAAVLDGTVLDAAVLDGTVLGREGVLSTSRAPTIFKSTGHAALDVAAASVVYAVARECGAGILVDL